MSPAPHMPVPAATVVPEAVEMQQREPTVFQTAVKHTQQLWQELEEQEHSQ